MRWDGFRNFGFDIHNRPRWMIAGAVIVEMTYDPLGRMHRYDITAGAQTARR